MRQYTKTEIMASLVDAVDALQEPVKPCMCNTYGKCRCESNELIQQINRATTILEDIINPNSHRLLERELTRQAKIEKAREAATLEALLVV